MKEFFKKIWARIKAFFGHQYVQTAITLILCIALCLGVVFGVRKCNKSMSTVEASAEVDSIYPYADSAIVSSGLLPSYYSQGNIVQNGVTYSVSVTGSISVVGTATADSVYFITYVDTPIELGIGEEYIFDFYRANSNVKVNCILQSTDYAVSYQNSATFVATRSYWYMYLFVRAGDTVGAFVQPMLSLGASVEPISSTYNLLKAPYNTSSSVNGITYSVGLDGSVILRGTASSDSVFYLNTVDDSIRLYYNTFYSFACYLSNPNASIECLLTDTSNSQEFKANRLFVPSYPRWRLSLKIPKGAVFDGLKVQIMLNTGQIYSGYVPPYLDLVSKLGNIFEDGKNEGYQEGYQEGMNTASRGIFKSCKVMVNASLNGSSVGGTYTPTYTDNGITFENVYQGLLSDYGSSVNILNIALIFDPTIMVGSIINFRATGPSVMFGTDNLWSASINLPSGRAGFVDARMGLLENTDDVYGLAFRLYFRPLYGDSFEITKATLDNSALHMLGFTNSSLTLTQLRTVKFWADNSAYYVGYENGYLAGENSGVPYQNGYIEGYNVGNTNGYNKGYSDGLAKAEKFDFAYAISTVLGAPVQVIQEFLNFELLGVNMLGFVSGLFTLMIIVKIIKMIV